MSAKKQESTEGEKTKSKPEPHPKEKREQENRSRWLQGFPRSGLSPSVTWSRPGALQQERARWPETAQRVHPSVHPSVGASGHGTARAPRQFTQAAARTSVPGERPEERELAHCCSSRIEKMKDRHWLRQFWKRHCAVGSRARRYLLIYQTFQSTWGFIHLSYLLSTQLKSQGLHSLVS